MTSDRDRPVDSELDELEDGLEDLEETTATLFDGVDDATDRIDGDTVAGVATSSASLLPSRNRLLGMAGGAVPLFLGVMLLGLSVVPITALEIVVAFVAGLRETLLGDLVGGALLGLVVGSVAFLFVYLAELAAGAV